MNKYEHKQGKGSLFVNDNRTEENNQPHYSGSCKDPNGVEWKISAWKNKSQDGQKSYLSMNFEAPKVEEKTTSTTTQKDDLSIDF